MTYNKSVCVFCGSRFGSDPEYALAAETLGRALALAKIRLVFGAGDVGLMGAVANACKNAGGATLGVIPTHLMEAEGLAALENTIITENMHERKKVMFMNSNAVVTLPGGAGSLDEVFEVLTWRQLGLHKKPVYLLNTNGYWNPLLGLIDHVIAQGFADISFRASFRVASDIPTLMDMLHNDFTKD